MAECHCIRDAAAVCIPGRYSKVGNLPSTSLDLANAVIEGDVVSMTRRSRGAGAKVSTVIAGPLVSGGNAVVPSKKMRGIFQKAKDSVEMNNIIGKGPRDFARSVKGEDYILSDPTLAEYTTFSPRLVTPVRYTAIAAAAMLITARSTLKTRASSSTSSIFMQTYPAKRTARNLRYLKLEPAMGP